MLILDKPRQFDGGSLRVPLYHRGHLPIRSETKVWLCFLPSIKGDKRLPELIVSSINFDAWSDLWRLTVTMREGVGDIHRILDVLQQENINIVSEVDFD